MSDYSVTLPVPEHIYDQARRLAEATHQPLEAVLIRQLEAAFSEPPPTLPSDEQGELDALNQLSDDALWTIAREQMQVEKQARLSILMEANSSGKLTDIERDELQQLVEDGQRLMLRKAGASALLIERGYTVIPQDITRQDG